MTEFKHKGKCGVFIFYFSYINLICMYNNDYNLAYAKTYYSCPSWLLGHHAKLVLLLKSHTPQFPYFIEELNIILLIEIE